MQFNYQFYSMPPIYADRGSVNISIDEISYSMELSISNTPLGKANVQISQFSLTFPPESLNFDFECLSDLSYRIFEEIVFYKDFLVERVLNYYQDQIIGNFDRFEIFSF